MDIDNEFSIICYRMYFILSNTVRMYVMCFVYSGKIANKRYLNHQNVKQAHTNRFISCYFKISKKNVHTQCSMMSDRLRCIERLK